MTRLFVKKLSLFHFRSHKQLHLETDDRPIAIHGANGVGKTNILEAVSMLSPGRGLRRAKTEDLSRKPDALGWKITAVLQSLHKLHELETSSEGGASRTIRIDEKISPQVALGRIARVLWLVPTMDRLWIEGAEGRRRFLDRMTMSFDPSHAEATLTYEKTMRERNRLLKDQVQDQEWFEALEAQMAVSGATIMSNRLQTISRIEQAQTDAETAFPAASLSLSGPDDADLPETRDALSEAFATGRRNDLYAGRTLIGPHRADMTATYRAKGIAAKQCSTGEQKALLISLILSNARALIDDFRAPPILLLDEVAAHLDADRRAALYDEICRLGTQAWMTGTGADLFEELGDRAQVFELRDKGGNAALHPS